MNLLLDLEEYVDSAYNEFCDYLDARIAESKQGKATVNMGELLQFLAMDVVGELAFGQSFGKFPSALWRSSPFDRLTGYIHQDCAKPATIQKTTCLCLMHTQLHLAFPVSRT